MNIFICFVFKSHSLLSFGETDSGLKLGNHSVYIGDPIHMRSSLQSLLFELIQNLLGSMHIRPLDSKLLHNTVSKLWFIGLSDPIYELNFQFSKIGGLKKRKSGRFLVWLKKIAWYLTLKSFKIRCPENFIQESSNFAIMRILFKLPH